jgi:tetratricopeptide (TPR) repeat protein
MKNGKNTLFIIIALAILTIIANFIRINISNSTSEQGKTAHDQGNYDMAISAYTRANKLIFWDKEKKAYNLFWRGRTYYYKQNFAKALSDFTEIIELQQDYYPYYTWLARTYYKMGNSELALANYDKSINLNELEGSVDWNTYLERADVYVVIGNNIEL